METPKGISVASEDGDGWELMRFTFPSGGYARCNYLGCLHLSPTLYSYVPYRPAIEVRPTRPIDIWYCNKTCYKRARKRFIGKFV